MSDYSDKILFGKNIQEKIVSLEPKDDVCELFIQNDDGNVRSEFVPNLYWILSNSPFGFHDWVRLKGNQHYKYALQFETRKEFLTFRYKNKDKDLYSVFDPREAHMLKYGETYFKGMSPKDVTVMSFDIETTGLNGKAKNAFLILISTTFRKNGIITKKLFSYDEYESEGAMIEAFASYIVECDPSILVGHNIISFDFRYIIDRADANNVYFSIGRDCSDPEVAKYETDFRVDGTRDLHYNKIRIYGREICDTMFLAYNMDVSRNYISYGLKQIIKQEGLEKEGRTFYDASKIRENYKDPIEYKKIKDYCIDDSDDALNLFDKIGSVYFNLCQMIPKTFTEVVNGASGSKLNGLMVRSYLQEGCSIPKASEIRRFPGGLSFGIPGIYDNIIKLDFSSLYPSIIIEYSVGNKLKDPNQHLLHVTKTMRENRLKYKKLYKKTGNELYNYMDGASKSVLNSLFGFLGSPGLNFNCLDSATFITTKGRELLQQSISYILNEPYQNFYERNKEHIDSEEK